MKMSKARLVTVGMLAVAVFGLSGCEKQAPKPQVASAAQPFKPDAGVQDIMADMIDPAADFLWESVSTSVDSKGSAEKRPTTNQEWALVRRQAIILAESSNLLMIEGRRVAREGKQLEDHGTLGNLSAAESEKAIAAKRADFVAHAQALHFVGEAFVAAADAQDTQAMLDAGDTMDQVCEACHLQFWYPGQVIPAFPENAKN